MHFEGTKLIKEWKPDAVVVGLPLNMDGTPSDMCLRAEKFARRLNGRYNLPFYTHDERLTTFEAKGERRDRGGQKGSYRDNPVDAIAAGLLALKADGTLATIAETDAIDPATLDVIE